VFESNGGQDTIVGQVRTQDIFQGDGLNDQRTLSMSQAATGNAATAAGTALSGFGSSDGLDALFPGLSRQELREMLADNVGLARGNPLRTDLGSTDGLDLTEFLLRTDLPSFSHDLGLTMIEQLSADRQPLDMGDLVNLSMTLERAASEVSFDTRYSMPSQYDILPF
jgi:hypothetical protein